MLTSLRVVGLQSLPSLQSSSLCCCCCCSCRRRRPAAAAVTATAAAIVAAVAMVVVVLPLLLPALVLGPNRTCSCSSGLAGTRSHPAGSCSHSPSSCCCRRPLVLGPTRTCSCSSGPGTRSRLPVLVLATPAPCLCLHQIYS